MGYSIVYVHALPNMNYKPRRVDTPFPLNDTPERDAPGLVGLPGEPGREELSP